MDAFTRFACTLLLCSVAIGAMSAPTYEIDEKALPPGVTRQQALELLTQADAVDAELERKEQAAFDRRGKQLQRATEKYQAAFRDAVAADPALAAEQARLESKLKALEGMKDDERTRALDEMKGELNGFRGKAFAKAAIDEAALQQELRAVVADDVTTRGMTENRETVTFGENGEMIISPAESSKRPQVESRGVFNTITLAAPFPYSSTERNIGEYGPTVDKTAGKYRSYARAEFLTSGTNKGQISHAFTIPAGTRNVRVRAEMSDIPYKHHLATIAGGGGAGGRSLIQVTHTNGTPCSASRTHPGVWGVVFGRFENQGTSDLFLDCTFASPGEGKLMLIRFTGYTTLTNVLGSSSNSENAGTPRNIRVDFLN